MDLVLYEPADPSGWPDRLDPDMAGDPRDRQDQSPSWWRTALLRVLPDLGAWTARTADTRA